MIVGNVNTQREAIVQLAVLGVNQHQGIKVIIRSRLEAMCISIKEIAPDLGLPDLNGKNTKVFPFLTL